jgi:hypothetical protein
MLAIQRKLGKDFMPLIEQNFYPDYAMMSNFVPRLPTVLKIGYVTLLFVLLFAKKEFFRHAHGGLGKIRVPTANDYQDASSVVAVTVLNCSSSFLTKNQ